MELFFNPSRLDLEGRDKNKFFPTFLCGSSKRFMNAFKAFIKPSEAPQKSEN